MYAVAEKLLATDPWHDRGEEDVFALQPREDGPVYFVSVMGKLGVHQGIAFYPGSESFSQFCKAQSEYTSDRVRFETMLLNGHLQVAFEQRKHLIAPDLEVLKKMGKRYRGRWPVFRAHRPARIPWLVNAAEARDLTLLLEQTLEVLKCGGQSIFRPFTSPEFFLRTWDGRDEVCRVDDLPVQKHVIQTVFPADALDHLQKAPLRFEADLVLMNSPVRDTPRGEPPYFPMLLLVADSATGGLVGLELLSTMDGIDAVYARIPEALTGILKKAKIVPKTIVARHTFLLGMLEAFGAAYGIGTKQDNALPVLTQAVESLMRTIRG